MMNYFTFDGVDSRDFNTFIATSNMFDAPEENVETIHIPYKNTPLHISEKTFKPFILKALCYIPDNMQNNIDELRNFLKSRFASCRYTEALRPGEFRIARFKSAFEVEKSDRQTAAFVLTFECAPQRYIIDNPTLTLSPTTSEATSYSLSTPAMPLPLTLEGNTTQKTLSGKNLLPTGVATVTNGGVTATRQTDGSYLLSGTSTSANADVYILRGEANRFSLPTASAYRIMQPTTSGIRLWLAIKRAESGNTVYNNSTFPMNDGDLVIGVFIRVATSGTNTNGIKVYPQIELGSTSTTYEQYCGGIPSPNPDYPQEIHSVSGDNEIRVVGFNLWDEVTANGYYGANGVFVANASYIAGKNKIPLLPSTQYCITSLKGNLGRICFYNADGTFNSTIVNYVGATVTKYTFTTNADVYFMAFDIRSGYGTTYTNDICINVSDTEKNGTYEPYKAQVYPINLGSIELNALGTYKDYFHKDNGKWYLHKAIGSQVGSTAPNSSGTASSGAYRYNYATVTRFKEYTEAQGGASSHFTYNINYNAPSGNFYNTGGNIIFFCDIAPADIGAWAQENKPIFYGILATPTETEITDTTLISQLNALSKAKTYDGSTTIVQDGTDAQFKLSMPVPTEISSEYFGEPIITVNEVGTIVWNDSLIKVNSAPVTINSQTLQCYYYSENKNNDVEINEFPKYEQGENYIGSTMALTVVPNYWKL